MPLIVMCGFPLSGKSFFVEQLKSHIEEKENRKVIIITDNNCGLSSDNIYRYSDSRLEKDLRAKLKSEVQNHLNENDIIILDSLNYIKGYRYELFCIAKSRSTPHCVIHCDVEESICEDRNSDINESNGKYPSEVLKGLLMRFERPIATNRWDSPLFCVSSAENAADAQQELFVGICGALLRRAAAVLPHKATQNPARASGDYLQQLEQQTQAVVKFIVDMQKSVPAGSAITVPGAAEERFVLRRYQTAIELQRSRRQFVASVLRIRNNNSSVSRVGGDLAQSDNVIDSFVTYLNKCS